MKLITPHKNQLILTEQHKRFNHIKCGRRFGKTFFINILLAKAFINESNGKRTTPFKIGIWFPTYKDLDHVWLKAKSDFHELIASKSETLKQIETISGGKIHFWSMENPDSGRGYDYDRAIIDEFAKAKKNKEAWQNTIRPTLTDRAGDAWIFSTPKGKSNYFFQLQLDHENDDDWAFFTFTSYDNPYLDPQEIDSAKNQLDKISFAQEYLAEDVDANERPFMYCFNEDKNVTTGLKLNPGLPLWFSFDFNVQPMTCLVAQMSDMDTVHVVAIEKRDSASVYDMCDLLKVKYPKYHWMFTGDASGRNRNVADRSKRSFWKIVKAEMRAQDRQFDRLRRRNLDHISSQIICNSVLEHKNVLINQECKELIDDIRYASLDDNGKLVKTPDRGLHFFDGFRYLLDALFPNILKIKS